MVSDFRALEVYQDAFDLALAGYKRARRFPSREAVDVVLQLRRSALSVVLNIAEGHGRRTSQKDFMRFISIAVGSANETMVLLEFAHRLGYLKGCEHEEYDEKYTVLVKRLKALYSKLRGHK